MGTASRGLDNLGIFSTTYSLNFSMISLKPIPIWDFRDDLMHARTWSSQVTNATMYMQKQNKY